MLLVWCLNCSVKKFSASASVRSACIRFSWIINIGFCLLMDHTFFSGYGCFSICGSVGRTGVPIGLTVAQTMLLNVQIMLVAMA